MKRLIQSVILFSIAFALSHIQGADPALREFHLEMKKALSDKKQDTQMAKVLEVVRKFENNEPLLREVLAKHEKAYPNDRPQLLKCLAIHATNPRYFKLFKESPHDHSWWYATLHLPDEMLKESITDCVPENPGQDYIAARMVAIFGTEDDVARLKKNLETGKHEHLKHLIRYDLAVRADAPNPAEKEFEPWDRQAQRFVFAAGRGTEFKTVEAGISRTAEMLAQEGVCFSETFLKSKLNRIDPAAARDVWEEAYLSVLLLQRLSKQIPIRWEPDVVDAVLSGKLSFQLCPILSPRSVEKLLMNRDKIPDKLNRKRIFDALAYAGDEVTIKKLEEISVAGGWTNNEQQQVTFIIDSIRERNKKEGDIVSGVIGGRVSAAVVSHGLSPRTLEHLLTFRDKIPDNPNRQAIFYQLTLRGDELSVPKLEELLTAGGWSDDEQKQLREVIDSIRKRTFP